MPYIGQVFIVENHDEDVMSGSESPTMDGKRKIYTSTKDTEFDIKKLSTLPLDTRLYVLRKIVSQRAKEMFICSLHSKTIVYKGQFKPDQLFHYYKVGYRYRKLKFIYYS